MLTENAINQLAKGLNNFITSENKKILQSFRNKYDYTIISFDPTTNYQMFLRLMEKLLMDDTTFNLLYTISKESDKGKILNEYIKRNFQAESDIIRSLNFDILSATIREYFNTYYIDLDLMNRISLTDIIYRDDITEYLKTVFIIDQNKQERSVRIKESIDHLLKFSNDIERIIYIMRCYRINPDLSVIYNLT
jgi:hypothetical protein